MSFYQSNAYNFGQVGSAYIGPGNTSIFQPPTGMVVVSIVSLSDDTGFTKLTPSNSDDSAYFGSTVHDTLNGTNPSTLPTNEAFPAGMALFGRWTHVQLNGTNAAVILYFGY